MTDREFRERRSAFVEESDEDRKPRAQEAVTPEAERETRPEREAGPIEPPAPGGDPLASMSLPDPSFIEIVQILALQALQLMGADPFGTGAEPQVHPEQARRFIDLLDILQQRTEGNLSAEEARVLEQILTDLRTQYLGLQP